MDEAPTGSTFLSDETLVVAPMTVEELNARLDALEPVLDEADTEMLAKLLYQKQALMDEVDEAEANGRLKLEPVGPCKSFDEELEGHDRNVRILMDAVTVPLQKYEDWLEGLPKKERSLLELTSEQEDVIQEFVDDSRC